MAKRSEYTIHGPPGPESSPTQLHKTLTIRREHKGAPADLRSLYRYSADEEQAEEPTINLKPLLNGIATNSNLPPTPPAANVDNTDQPTDETLSESIAFRSALVTPINQSPPTPDNTPPRRDPRNELRPFLGPQASFASTRAESFKTAREEITSDDESVAHCSRTQTSRRLFSEQVAPALTTSITRSGLSHISTFPSEDVSPTTTYVASGSRGVKSGTRPAVSEPVVTSGIADNDATPRKSESRIRKMIALDPAELEVNTHADAGAVKLPAAPLATGTYKDRTSLRRGPSLRERLQEVHQQSPTASTEKFAEIIGWDDGVSQRAPQSSSQQSPAIMRHEKKRLSGLSTTSTVSAMVVDTSPLPRRRTTLRKIAKNDSLRSASSPLPASQRSRKSQVDSSPRLVHKKVRLSNENRLSFGSGVSRSRSLSSNTVPPKPEVIKVAVIPQRSSSLHSSTQSSRRHSLSTTSAKTPSKKLSEGVPPSSWQRKRPLSESERGRDKEQALRVPPRSSSLSAPTSRSTSRANSIISESVRRQRRAAETDLRRTLDRMESERLLSSLRGSQFGSSPVETPSKAPSQALPKQVTLGEVGRQKSLTPGTSEWAALRPPSILATPFSQPSYQSASPEINEATAINYFPHNNNSLQLIEPNLTQESRAVREVRNQIHIHDETSSPLRNPRQPPEPPHLSVVPSSPADEMNHQIELPPPEIHANPSRRRPSQHRSESFVKTLTRGLSLKNARNRKADQELDGSLHPFWRPRPFWDEEEDITSRGVIAERSQSMGTINNSLGFAQQRTVITGPVSLVKRLSERKRQNRPLMKQSSHGSLARLRASRQFYNAPNVGMSFRFINLRAIPERLLYARQRKEDEKQEKRRALLRRSIGPNIIPQGDSRFPTSNSNSISS